MKSYQSYLTKIGKNFLAVVSKRLQQLLEMMMTDADDLRKPLTSHCKWLWDIKYHSQLPSHFWRSQF